MQKQDLMDKILSLKTFRYLTPKDAGELVRLGKVYAFEEKTAVYFPGDPIKGTHFVLEGSLVTYKGKETREYYGPRDHLGISALIWPSSIDQTCQGYSPGKSFYLSRDAFLTFVKGDSGRKKRLLLGLQEALPEGDPLLLAMARFKVPKKKKTRGAWDMEKEIPLIETRPSGLMLLPKFFVPLVFLFAQFPLGFALENWLEDTDPNLIWALPSFLILLSLVVIMALYFQWRTDKLTLTTEFLVRKKFLFSQRGWEIVKIPLDQVQALSIKRSGFFQSLFGLNSLEFSTSAEKGTLEFHHLSDARSWEEQIAHILEQGRRHMDGLEKEAMRQFLSQHWPGRKVLEALDIPGVGEEEKPRHQATKGPSLFSYRWREGENLFFRRHPITLVVNSLLPILLGGSLTLVDLFGLHLGLGSDPSPYLEYLCGGAGDITTGRGPLAILGLDFGPLYGWEAFFDGLG
jgi:membrane protein YdbS with pleckstrin-like domain